MSNTLKMQTHTTELTRKDFKLVDLLEQYWLVKGNIPTQEQAAKMGLSPRFYMSCMKNTKFREQLAARGLGVEDPNDPKLVSWALTEKQLTAANIMLDMLDNRSRKRKLDGLEIPTQEYQAWLKDPAFQQYLRARSEGMLKDNIHESHMALVDKARMGDINAIKYLNEMTGRYIPASARASAIDPMDIIQSVIEILQAEITDKELLKKIGNSLMGLMGRAVVTHEIDNATAMAHDNSSDVSSYGSVINSVGYGNLEIDTDRLESLEKILPPMPTGEETSEAIQSLKQQLPDYSSVKVKPEEMPQEIISGEYKQQPEWDTWENLKSRNPIDPELEKQAKEDLKQEVLTAKLIEDIRDSLLTSVEKEEGQHAPRPS